MTENINNIIDSVAIETSFNKAISVDKNRERYEQKQAELLYQNAGLALFGTTAASSLVAYYFYGYTDTITLAAWYFGLFLVSILRYVIVQAYHSAIIKCSNHIWIRAFEVGTALSGIAWGSAAILLIPDDSFTHHTMLAFVFGGLCAATVAIYTASKFAAPSFTVFTLLPLIYSLHIIDEPLALPMEVLVFMYLLAIVLVMLRIHATMSESIALALHNKGLVDYLSNALQERDELNEQLCQEIDSRKDAEDKLSFEASHDSLTGLINRREFENRLDKKIKQTTAASQQHALMYLDLDQFKVVNDTCGHAAGDELLKQISSKMPNFLRESDSFSRLGGDEFGVLLENCPLEKAKQIAETLRNEISKIHFVWDSKVFESSASVGVVPITATSGTLAELMSSVDSACYIAKDMGRNRVHVLSEDDTAVAKRYGELQWVHGIKDAIDEDRIVLFVQKIMPLDPNNMEMHFEVLMRMQSEGGDLIPPMAYIPAAERYDLMPALDRHVIRKSFSYIQKLSGSNLEKSIFSINLSGQSFCDEHFLENVIVELEASGVDPKLICFEVTETAAIGNLNDAQRFMSVLSDMGCQFSLDDFGSGLSSFSYLKNLDVDYLKIDGCFVKDIETDKVDEAMVQSINQVGQVLGMKTIAEFVENDEIVNKLKTIGVDYVQGYGIEKPHPFDDLLDA